MGDSVPELAVLKANLRWRRSIYLGITIAGGLLCVPLALYLGTGGELEGAAIAFATLAPGALLIGLALLLPNSRVESSAVVRLLRERPQAIRRIGLKRTESNIAGVDAARYEWIVLETGTKDRVDDRLEVLVKQQELRTVLAEIRACAPDADFDRQVDVQRLKVR
ncbi:MAG TPA: hypothetical protein PKA88_10630 [Polyangiaceae bacterium]|nr:hypothetical protein [Polyangiaceae bacterium]